MTESSTVLLTQRVPYDWEELKSISEQRPRWQERPVAPSVFAPAAQTEVPTKAGLNEAEVDQLIKLISQQVAKTLSDEIDLVVELTLKKTRAHLKTDIEKAVTLNVTRSVREAFRRKAAGH